MKLQNKFDFDFRRNRTVLFIYYLTYVKQFEGKLLSKYDEEFM